MRRPLALALAAALLPCTALADGEPFHPVLDLEAGVLWTSRNDISAPGASGTRFSASSGDFDTQTAPFARLQAGLRLGRHALALTFAPVRLQGNGASGATIQFRDQTFTADGGASIRYQADTYRLTYRYALVDRAGLDLQLGLGALVRDTEIRLAEEGHDTTERSVSVLPVVSFRLAFTVAGPFRLAVDGEAGALRRGRSEDLSVALEFRAADLTFRAGYRLAEGAVDDRRLYNSAWLNHALVGVRYEL